MIFTDTVGFLRKLPHQLVASFRSTLEVARESDLLCIVLDASSPWSGEQFKTVEQVLAELEATDAPRMVVFNKIDLVEDPFERKRLSLMFPNSFQVSAFVKEDVLAFKNAVSERLDEIVKEREREELIRLETQIAQETW